MSNERGRGRGGNRGGRGGMEGGSARRGAWRNGPPAGSFPHSRGGSPALGQSPTPRMSINDHMHDLKIVHGEHKGFQTDTDISRTAGPVERELQPWVPDGPSPPPLSNGESGNADFETFGTTNNITWDQFETNERLFGAKTDFKEELYTTKLNKSGPDFHKREKEAERLAKQIMGQTSKNAHIAEERGQATDTRDEEEKYSGVSRAPNAYVPPSARRAMGQSSATLRPDPTSESKTNGSTPVPAKTASPAALETAPPVPERRISDDPVGSKPEAPAMKVTGTTVRPITENIEVTVNGASVTAETKPELSGVVNEWRQFVGTEREKVEAKKQSVLKSEKEKQLADFKKFQANFKVPLPLPKDILPILSKDEAKQKDIEAKATSALQAAKERKSSIAKDSPAKSPATLNSVKSDAPKPAPPKKIVMKIPEIPPFNPAKRKAPAVPVPESATQDIKLITSPAPSNGSLASQATKLNPTASTFVFKPRADAAPFKPGQPSVSPSIAPNQPSAGPSNASASATAPKGNAFFRDKLPEKTHINAREDFNPWKHGPVPRPNTVGTGWPYPGRKVGVPPPFMSPAAPPQMQMQFEDDPTSPSPHPAQPAMMPGMPPNYPPYGRFQPGMPPPYGVPGGMQNPMFSPGPHFSPHPGQPMGQPPQHMMPGGPQPNMPMYFQNGMPQNPAFLPPQMQQFPHNPQRPGPGPGPGPGGPQMFYPNQMPPMPHQTPLQQHTIPFSGPSPAQPQFQHQHQHQHQGQHPHQQAPPPPPVQMSPAHSTPNGPGGVVQGGPQQNGQTQG
ncbi:hypothetical protein CNBE4880 [Cryptococcus deneoformans B-3501A]|uniref:mRNA polyadenylation-related protein, putative n=1 Tax=Cryptococcus deneoformans (strain JEC21 / ATCC MYA-565) TaxID=214684 RepID=Q5KG47_CRYD1|nr:mRNA polyadenylation-related protein, putative [Cryptococcus neoformans var. neoformans JEC21]XP_775215.1 hypothetical protein CNBE4880 [Cryptococcus neoformans var. neoformans B-3501A]AAW43699.1 mRNA polyadenylation-related protein, putative [Cryptococcus neoformans var. neoformans JEC21]EAL20568.1 hypothetical protein CNBE4880 [Cryptococcus neoformans var. neoformans B-3501A]